jgi:hypothetical protein
MVAYYVAMGSIVAERFLAIYKLESYEQANYSAGIALSVVCQICGLVGGMLLLFYGKA